MRASPFFFVSLLIAVVPAYAGGAPERPVKAVTEEGTIAGADFRIDIPEGWNGGLVMYAHGYARVDQAVPFIMEMVKVTSSLGYAIAQSKYSHQGWAVREGILDTEALRRYFVDKYGPAYPTIIAGHSQGGLITYGTIERFPEAYDGALPMCGVGSSGLEILKDRAFDMRALFDYFFPGLSGSAVEFPDGPDTFVKTGAKAAALVQANSEAAKEFARMQTLSSPAAIAPVVALCTEILHELKERTGGNAFDNRDTIYSGSSDDAKLNKEIKRYAADAKSVEYLTQWVSFTGEIRDPVLALHTLVDDLIPPRYANLYDAKTLLAGTHDLYAMSWTNGANHCAFTIEEMTEALRQLTEWIKTGKRPVTGDWSKK